FKGCFHEVWCDSPQPEYTSLSVGLALSRFGLWPAGSQTVSLIPQESHPFHSKQRMKIPFNFLKIFLSTN
ncbi:hypothetical protein P4J25_32145, partial [Bacillus cereus]|nr:hypothetical protein [Bacillus cereus]